MKNEKGITLISLVITIIVLLILASISSYIGVNSVKESGDSAVKAELQLVQQAAFQKYAKYNLTGNQSNLPGNSYVDFTKLNEVIEQIKQKTGVTIEFKDNDANNYYLLDINGLQALGITNTQDEYIVNYTTGEVINKTRLATTQSKEPLYIYGRNGE